MLCPGGQSGQSSTASFGWVPGAQATHLIPLNDTSFGSHAWHITLEASGDRPDEHSAQVPFPPAVPLGHGEQGSDPSASKSSILPGEHCAHSPKMSSKYLLPMQLSHALRARLGCSPGGHATQAIASVEIVVESHSVQLWRFVVASRPIPQNSHRPSSPGLLNPAPHATQGSFISPPSVLSSEPGLQARHSLMRLS